MFRTTISCIAFLFSLSVLVPISSAKKKNLIHVSKTRIYLKQKIKFNRRMKTIEKQSHQMLNAVANYLRNHKNIRVRIEGHTNSRGSSRFNRMRSKKRAEMVRQYLFSQGVMLQNMKAVGRGEDRPIASNRTRAGRKKNARIEIHIIKK